jgi:hypothetical protein
MTSLDIGGGKCGCFACESQCWTLKWYIFPADKCFANTANNWRQGRSVTSTLVET